jgi:MscS family membrane protein
MIKEALISTLVLLAFLLVGVILNRVINKRIDLGLAKKHRGVLIKKTLNIFFLISTLLAIIFIWGIDFENVFVLATSIFALIAIAMFAVWSILSNVLAGIILFFSGEFKIGDEIQIYPEKIKGKIINITSVFVIIKDNKGDFFKIPNNMVFQRVVKSFKRS